MLVPADKNIGIATPNKILACADRGARTPIGISGILIDRQSEKSVDVDFNQARPADCRQKG
jgi:hypothetical protein